MTSSRQLRIGLSESGELAVFIPSPVSIGGGHTVEVPCSIEGLRLIRDILQRHNRGEASTIGTKASPVQYDVNALLASFRPQPKKVTTPSGLDFEINMEDLKDITL